MLIMLYAYSDEPYNNYREKSRKKNKGASVNALPIFLNQSTTMVEKTAKLKTSKEGKS